MIAIIALGGLSLSAVLLFRMGSPGAPKCPLTFPEFSVTPKQKAVNVSGRATYASGVPFPRGPVEINLTFMMPGCAFVPFSATTDRDGRFSADSPPKDPLCVSQGGTATAKTKAGCEIEGATQGSW